MRGDVNNDSSVDSSDASAVLVEYARIQTGGEALFTDVQKNAADINNDRSIDASDASEILAFYAYISTGGRINDIDKWKQDEKFL